MRIIEWHLDVGIVGADRSGEVEVEDAATDKEIDAEVREAVFNFISWGWNEKKAE